MVTHQLQVERRTGKVRWPETDVVPLCHATNRLISIEKYFAWHVWTPGTKIPGYPLLVTLTNSPDDKTEGVNAHFV